MFKTNRFFISLMCIALLFAALPGAAGATGLPPRPPLPAVGDQGALIELRVPTTSLNYFTVVQWQGTDLLWHNVDTWQGNLDDFFFSGGRIMAYKQWWVYPADYGKQNFRWQVFNKPGGKLLVTSATFNLPARGRQDVISVVALP